MEALKLAGFRAGRSTIDHLFSVTQLIEKKTAYEQELHMVYIDLKKAYGIIPQIKLWEALEKTNISQPNKGRKAVIRRKQNQSDLRWYLQSFIMTPYK
jgi:hypothetical protein